MLKRQIELLQQMPIFGALPAEALELLLEGTRSVERLAGSFFFHEGEPAVNMYVIEEGSVSVLRGWHGRETLLRRLRVGDCFGEMALLDLSPRSASVKATEDCSAIELGPGNLYRLYERDVAQFATIQMNIAREMSRRLRETDELLFRARMEGQAPDSQAGKLNTS